MASAVIFSAFAVVDEERHAPSRAARLSRRHRRGLPRRIAASATRRSRLPEGRFAHALEERGIMFFASSHHLADHHTRPVGVSDERDIR